MGSSHSMTTPCQLQPTAYSYRKVRRRRLYPPALPLFVNPFNPPAGPNSVNNPRQRPKRHVYLALSHRNIKVVSAKIKGPS
jgi:hypothetical protein